VGEGKYSPRWNQRSRTYYKQSTPQSDTYSLEGTRRRIELSKVASIDYKNGPSYVIKIVICIH